MPDPSADDLRALIRARWALNERAETMLGYLQDAIDARSAVSRVTLTCDHPHRKGVRRKTAELYPFGGNVLYVAVIPWVPSDMINRRPWMTEHLLGCGMGAEVLESVSDAALLRFRDTLNDDVFSPASGARWVQKTPPHRVLTIITPDTEPVITPWARCPDHPDHAETFTREEILSLVR